MRPQHSIDDWRRAAHQLATFWGVLGGVVALWPCNLQAQDWVRHNRSLALSASASELRYREIDTQGLTRDGTLNTERGVLSGGSVQGRWQASEDSAVPLWVQGNIDWVQGRTAYQGYLQSGSQLTSYSARTGNKLVTASASVGFVLPMDARRVQLLPHINIGQRQWQRNLVQYGENYSHRRAGFGLLAQWLIAEGMVVEFVARVAGQNRSQVVVPKLDFDAEQGLGTEISWSSGVYWMLTPVWQIYGQISSARWENGSSPVVSGFLAPPNQHRQVDFSAGISWHY